MATITTSTQAQGLSYPSASYMDRSPVSGNLAVVVRLTSGELRVYQSVNNGTSWTDTTAGFNRSNLQEWSGLFIGTDGYVHIAYRVYESGNDKIYYRRAGLNDSNVLVWDSEVLVSSVSVGASGAVYQGVDVISVKIGDAYYVHLAVGTTSGSNVGVTMFSVKITYEYSWFFFPYWAYTVSNSLISGTRSWFVVGSGRVTPALDFRHNGDAHTSSVPDLWVAFGRAQTCIARISYGSGKWTGSTLIALATPTTAMDANPGRFDGSRFLVPSLNGSKVDVYERDLSNTTTQLRQSPTHTTGVVKYVAIDYVPSTGDFRLFAVGTSTAVLYYVDYVRATNSWGAWTSAALTIVNNNNFGTRRGAYGNARFDLYTQTGSSPYTLSGTHQLLAFAPNTPVWLTPTTGSAQDVGAALTLTWQFSDVNPSDTQSAYAISRQIGAGALAYWNAGTSTWDVAEVQNSSATSAVTLPIAWGLDADATHVYKVKVWDATSLPSGYSSGLSIIPSVPLTPSIITPGFLATNVITDTFTRVASTLNGTTPDVSPSTSWVTGGWSVNPIWSIDGSKIVSLIDANVSAANITGLANINTGTNQLNSRSILTGIYISTLASTASARYIMARIRVAGVDYLGAYIQVNTAGVPILTFIKTVGGVATGTWGGNVSLTGVVPSNTALNGPYELSLTALNNVITAKVSGPLGSVIASRYLTNAEVTTLTNATQSVVGFLSFSGVGTPQLEATVDGYTFDTLSITTFNGPFITAQWSATGQAAYRITLNDVTSGASIQTYDSGWVISAAQSVDIPFRLTDLTTYNITVQVKNAKGLVGPAIDRIFYVDYAEPATPTYTVSPNSSNGVIELSITNIKPSGPQPIVASNDIYRRTIGDISIGTRIASTPRSTYPANLITVIDNAESVDAGTIGGWSNSSNALIAYSSAQALDGIGSIRLTAIANSTQIRSYVTTVLWPAYSMPIVAGKQYRVSAWSRAATTPKLFKVTVYFRDINNVNLASVATPVVINTTSGWTQSQSIITAPANAAVFLYEIGIWDTVVTGEQHYFDRMEIVAVDDPIVPVTYNDFTARHNVNYEYRIQAIGVNGAAQYGAWVS